MYLLEITTVVSVFAKSVTNNILGKDNRHFEVASQEQWLLLATTSHKQIKFREKNEKIHQ